MDKFDELRRRADDMQQHFLDHMNSPSRSHPSNAIASSGDGQLPAFHDFRGAMSQPGYILEYGRQEPSPEGWLFHSSANGSGDGSSARFYYDYIFNADDRPITHIMACMRGAPDPGKNSNVYLIEPNVNGVQDGVTDEIDIVEVYGSWDKAEWCVYKRGNQHKVGPGRYPLSSPGHHAYIYSIYLYKGKCLLIKCRDEDGNVVGTKELFNDDVPDRPLRLYSGIWDQGPDAFHGDAYMSLNWLYMAIE